MVVGKGRRMMRKERVIKEALDEVKAAKPEHLKPKRSLHEFLDEVKRNRKRQD